MCHKHLCSIVPPYILEQLAKLGNNSCKRTLLETQRIAQSRNMAINNLLQRTDEESNGKRIVYDCLNEYRQKVRVARSEGDAKVADSTTNHAYELSGFVRKYFKETFGLNSLDGKGMPIISNVHYGKAYNNAFWDGDEITYGDGDDVQFSNFAAGIDVVAHELTHGITQFLGNLEYKGQSGALNEHFSDVFATVIKQLYLAQDISEADWLIGDTVVADGFPGKAIRSMSAPGTANEFDSQPDHMDNYYIGSSDNYGVHINSGIPNRAFYLSCMAIGINDCALIWFGTLNQLWRTANFNDMLTIIIKVTKELMVEGKVCSNAENAILDSFSIVGINKRDV
ncbi:M4 family metallopeptidase [Arenibacter latericius]|uniref:M4 family metallopeptidase n=1 Tax=Arenibacter latericius TaxID=86104 RepID=UPI00047B425F|nr:M4 family metallopeptidase [Arenibacter latericius]MDX1363920.1 M4 family metallopeptidase [Arenibacter latericius]